MATNPILLRSVPSGAQNDSDLIRQISRVLAVLAVLLVAASPLYAETAESAESAERAPASGGEPTTDTDAGADATTAEAVNKDPRFVDRSYESVENMVLGAVSRVDSFFGNSEQSTFDEESSRIRLRLNTDYIQHHGWEVKPKVKLHLLLPGISSRLRLVMNEDETDDGDQASSTTDDENDVALRWIGKQSKKRGYSFDLGLRLKSGHLDPFGRINAAVEYGLTGKWVGQSTNRVYYYSRTGFRNDFRQYFNRSITDDLLFRSRTRLQYFAENDYNPYIEQKFSLYQSLGPGRKVAWEALYELMSPEDSPFDENEILVPDAKFYQHYRIQARFRQQVGRPWFFMEFWPIIAWPEERDYETILGARIRLEVSFGSAGDPRLDE